MTCRQLLRDLCHITIYMPDYYYLHNGERQGPYTLDYIRSMNLPADTPILRGDTNEWIKSTDFGGLITDHERHLVGGDDLPTKDIGGWFVAYLGILVFQSLFWSVFSLVSLDWDMSFTQLFSSTVYLAANIMLLVIAIQWPTNRYKVLMICFAALLLIANLGSTISFQLSNSGIFQ